MSLTKPLVGPVIVSSVTPASSPAMLVYTVGLAVFTTLDLLTEALRCRRAGMGEFGAASPPATRPCACWAICMATPPTAP